MKRLFALMLALLLLLAAGCQPSPEHEIVVNKGDDTLDNRINATQPPAKAAETAAPLVPQLFPERWDDGPGESDNRIVINAGAEVISREDGIYPVYHTLKKTFSEDYATAIFEKLLGLPVAVCGAEKTKAEYQEELQAYLDDIQAKREWIEAGYPPSPDAHWDESPVTDEEIAETTAIYLESIKNAPESNPEEPVSDYSGFRLGKGLRYKYPSGEQFGVYADGNGISIGLPGKGVYDELRKEEEADYDENPGVWHEPQIPLETAEAELNRIIELLGFTDFSVRSRLKADLVDQNSRGMSYAGEAGWYFVLERSYGGYPLVEGNVYVTQFLKYGDDEGFTPNVPVIDELIKLFIDEKGLRRFDYQGPKDVSELLNENVELLSFEALKARIGEAFVMCFPFEDRYLKKEGDFVVNVYKLVLTTYTVRVKDGAGYYEMPCWMVFWDCDVYGWGETPGGQDLVDKMILSRDKPWEPHDFLLINAVDGSIISPKYNY